MRQDLLPPFGSEDMTTTVKVYQSPAEAFAALELLYCTCDAVRVSRIPTHIGEQLLEQCGYRLADGSFSLDLSKCRRLGSPNQYIGNAGAIALALFVKAYLPRLEHLCLDSAIVEVGLTNPRSVAPTVALQSVLDSLVGSSLMSLDLSNIPLGARGYRSLTYFLKLTPSITTLKVHSCALTDNEARGLQIYVEHNRASGGHKRRSVPQSPHVASNGPGYFFSPQKLEELLTRPPKRELGLYTAADALNAEQRGHLPPHMAIKSEVRLAVSEGFRERPKEEALRERLVEFVSKIPSIEACFYHCFPDYKTSIDAGLADGSGPQDSLREVLGIGPSLDAEEKAQTQETQLRQKKAILRFIADSLQFALCKDGDVLVDIGDSPQWISFIESPADASLVLRKGADVVAEFPAGSFAGEHEVLSRMGSRVYSMSVRSPSGSPVSVWQLSREVYQRVVMPFLFEHRRATRKIVESMPLLTSLPNASRLSLCHSLRPLEVDIASLHQAARSRDAARLGASGFADSYFSAFPLMGGAELQHTIVVVEEGTVLLRRGVTDLKELSRGDVLFIRGIAAGSGGMVLVSAPIRQSVVRLHLMPHTALQTLPVELRAAFERAASGYDDVSV